MLLLTYCTARRPACRYDRGGAGQVQGPYQPDPMSPSWNCSVANFTMSTYSMDPNKTVGGWATLMCNTTMPYMCRMQTNIGTPAMTTQITNVTFYLNTTETTFADAEVSCKDNGGHIAGFTNETEQYEVEQFFISQGYLLPTYNKVYWYGASTNSTLWPIFSHMYGNLGDVPDRYWEPPTPGATAPPGYQNWWGAGAQAPLLLQQLALPAEHCNCTQSLAAADELRHCWAARPRGNYMPGNLTEPNGNWSGIAVETCLVGNSSEAGLNGTWAWADANCTSKYPFLCRINSGQARLQALRVAWWHCCSAALMP